MVDAWVASQSLDPDVGRLVDAESLSHADVLRVRIAKLLARLLPADHLRSRPRRRAVREAIRREVGRLLGAHPLPPSRYLDRARRPPELL